jgi:hypothetical protein
MRTLSRRLDALTRRRVTGERNDGGVIELRPADHEEPTWEVRLPGARPKRRLDGRTRAILSAAAAAAIVVNAGAAWLYWRITGSETGHRDSGNAVELALRARSDLNRPLLRGQTGNLTVSVVNDNDFPIRITWIAPGPGTVVADAEHRDRGCKAAAVWMTGPRFEVSWEVQRNTVGAFTLAGALAMRADADAACDGATFTVPVRASGVRRPVT